MRPRLTWLWRIWKQYLSNCGIHGARYLVDNDLSWMERIFWLISCTLCWWGCISTIMNVIQNYFQNPVVLSAENTYLNWQTPFPSISLCIKNTERMKSRYLKQPLDIFDVTSSTKVIKTSAEELSDAYKETKALCNMFLRRCIWDDMEFNCCEEFLPLFETGVGYCLTTNSLHTGRKETQHLNFFINRTVKYGDLIIDIIMNETTESFIPQLLTVYILNNYQIPTLFTSKEKQKTKIEKGFTTRLDLLLIDIYNEEPVKSVSMERRNCRFTNEVDNVEMHYIYSTDTCIIELYIRQMLKICGCVNFHYSMSLNARICNMTEVKCILDNEREIKSTVMRKSCLPNCEGTLIHIHYNKPSIYGKLPKDIGRLHFKLLGRPLIRYRRYVMSDLLDLAVSIGSAFGLFMGASILSFFEIIYWLFVRYKIP